MKLLLIRHGETVDNVAGVYAGITDSPLTNHGALQAQRLGQYLHSNGHQISRIFSSDLQRAYLTAEAICNCQNSQELSVTQLECLREQNLGSLEGRRVLKKFGSESSNETLSNLRSETRNVESPSSMNGRANNFINKYLVPLLKNETVIQSVVVVSHGIFLKYLWKAFTYRVSHDHVSTTLAIYDPDDYVTFGHRLVWSNTGYLELELQLDQVVDIDINFMKSHIDFVCFRPGSKADCTTSPPQIPGLPNQPTQLSLKPENFIGSAELREFFKNIKVVIKNIDSLEHLKGLKKTRGGVGNIRHDTSQRTMDSFFKKTKK